MGDLAKIIYVSGFLIGDKEDVSQECTVSLNGLVNQDKYIRHDLYESLQKKFVLAMTGVRYAYAQETQTYGMIEPDTSCFRQRKVFSILEDTIDKIDKEK